MWSRGWVTLIGMQQCQLLAVSTWPLVLRPEARCLPLSESEGKRGSYVIPTCALCNGSKDESWTKVVFGKKINKQQRQLFMRYHHSQPKTGRKKNLTGKLREKTTKNGRVTMLMTKRHIQPRSNDQHCLLVLTEVKTKEYHHSECMEKYKVH